MTDNEIIKALEGIKMISYIKNTPYSADKSLVSIACNSNDTKPTTGIVTGSKAEEVDTGKKFAFDEESGDWIEQPSGGGGGGGGRVSVAILTMTNTSEDEDKVISMYGPHIEQANFGPYGTLDIVVSGNTDSIGGGSSEDIEVVLVDGKAFLEFSYDMGEAPTVSGGLEMVGEDIGIMTGDATISAKGTGGAE